MIFKVIVFSITLIILREVESIYLGLPTQMENSPHLVTVIKDNRFVSLGVIISPHHILAFGPEVCDTVTQSHNFTIRSGTEKQSTGGKVTQVAKIICHEKYGQGYYKSFIAVLVLNKKCGLTFDKKTNMVALASKKPKVGKFGFLSGSNMLDKQISIDIYFHTAPVQVMDCPEKEYGIFCAGGKGGPKNCRRDAGASLIVDGKLAGFDKWGLGCSEGLEKTDKYISIADFKDWIEEKMRDPIPDDDVECPDHKETEVDKTEALLGQLQKVNGDLDRCKVQASELSQKILEYKNESEVVNGLGKQRINRGINQLQLQLNNCMSQCKVEKNQCSQQINELKFDLQNCSSEALESKLFRDKLINEMLQDLKDVRTLLKIKDERIMQLEEALSYPVIMNMTKRKAEYSV